MLPAQQPAIHISIFTVSVLNFQSLSSNTQKQIWCFFEFISESYFYFNMKVNANSHSIRSFSFLLINFVELNQFCCTSHNYDNECQEINSNLID